MGRMGEGESSASREPRGPLTILPMPAPGCACGAHSRMGSRTAFRPPFLPALTGPLSRGWTVGPARVLASFRGITGSSEAGAGCCLPGGGPWGPLLCPLGSAPPPGRCSGSPVSCRWVQEFLNEENRGLDVLLEYLAFAQCSVA